jgi:hypothetical protein
MTGVFFSCGIEEHIYLDPVETINDSGLYTAQFVLPNSSASTYFRNYTIYYRIYLSSFPPVPITTDYDRNNINPRLESHYKDIDSYITNENRLPSEINSAFTRANYFPLSVSLDRTSEINLNNLLSLNGYGTVPPVQSGGVISLDFSDSSIGPFMTFSYDTTSTQYFLSRYGKANPSPNENILFYQYTELFDLQNIGSEINLDIEKPGQNFSELTKTAYVSMYILAVGIDYNYSPLYSRALHLGIFKLPDLR